MEQYKAEFIEFMIESEVLTFGDFVTKSGRKTPFFINTGKYRTGEQIKKLGKYYAQAIADNFGSDFTTLFGPAYKGIPLAVTAAIALEDSHGTNCAFCFNRKEAKDHGEGGTLIGHTPHDGDSVIIIEDVTTAGTSVRESVPLLKSCGDVTVKGLVVSVDRMEKGTGEKSALQELSEEFSMNCCAVVTLDEIVKYLYNRELNGRVIIDDTLLEQIDAYRAKYGV